MYNSLHHSFNASLAVKYGMEESVFIHHFQYWISLNKRLKKNFHEGKTWTYQTQKELLSHFPYIKNRNKLMRIIDSLIEQGVIVTGNFNKLKLDKTLWYAFKNEELFVPSFPEIEDFEEPENHENDEHNSPLFENEQSMFKNEQCLEEKPVSKSNNALFKNEQPIPDNIYINITSNNTTTNKGGVEGIPKVQKKDGGGARNEMKKNHENISSDLNKIYFVLERMFHKSKDQINKIFEEKSLKKILSEHDSKIVIDKIISYFKKSENEIRGIYNPTGWLFYKLKEC